MRIALAATYTVFLWWFATGVILYLDGLPRRTFRTTLTAATVVLVLACAGLAWTARDTTEAAAYCAFTCAILVWAWQEIAFLLGYVVGPRRTACPPGATGFRRAAYAFEAILHHEIALVVLGALVVALTWNGTNITGVATFGVLWVMRQSAKLNLFLGVRNHAEEFLPDHLRYIGSYFRRAPCNALFPFSAAGSVFAAVWFWQLAIGAAADLATEPASAGAATTNAFAATLLTLAAIEHFFLVLPIPSTALWRWGLRSR